MGELLWLYFTLANSDEETASWTRTVALAEKLAGKAKLSGSRTSYFDDKARFQGVAHLWFAWRVRDGRLNATLEVPGSGLQAFFEFLSDAEFIRRWGQSWRPKNSRSNPLPADTWVIPEASKAALRAWAQPGQQARIPLAAIPAAAGGGGISCLAPGGQTLASIRNRHAGGKTE